MRSMALLLGTLAAIAAAPSALASDVSGREAPLGRVAASQWPVPDAATVQPAGAGKLRAPTSADAEAVLVGGGGYTSVAAGPAPCGPCRIGYDDCGNKRWSVDLFLGGWLWAQTGTVGVNGRDADVDTSLSDSLDLFKDHGEATLTGGLRVNYGRCFLSTWASYIRLDGQTERLVTGEPVNVEYKGMTAQMVVGYRVNEVTLGCGPCAPCLAFEPFVGARYNGMEMSIDGPQIQSSKDQDWWDPIVGCNFRVDFRNGWWSSVAFDVGGFGVGSDMTWSARADVGYMFNEHFGIFTGVMAIDWDYNDDGFRFDLTQWGPYLGLVVHF